jgi:hypothetical protein
MSKRYKYKPRKRSKPYDTTRRKRLQPTSSGQYVPTTKHLTPHDFFKAIDPHMTSDPRACWLPPDPTELKRGYIRGKTWYVAERLEQFDRKKRPKTHKRRVIDILYEHFYKTPVVPVRYALPYRNNLGIFYYHHLRSWCKTAGCVNPHHYIREVHMKISAFEVFEIFKECLRTHGTYTYETDNQHDAEQLRSQMYNYRPKFLKEYPQYTTEIMRLSMSAQEHGLEFQPVHQGTQEQINNLRKKNVNVGAPLPPPEVEEAPLDPSIAQELETALANPHPVNPDLIGVEDTEAGSIAEILYGAKTDDKK